MKLHLVPILMAGLLAHTGARAEGAVAPAGGRYFQVINPILDVVKYQISMPDAQLCQAYLGQLHASAGLSEQVMQCAEMSVTEKMPFFGENKASGKALLRVDARSQSECMRAFGSMLPKGRARDKMCRRKPGVAVDETVDYETNTYHAWCTSVALFPTQERLFEDKRKQLADLKGASDPASLARQEEFDALIKEIGVANDTFRIRCERHVSCYVRDVFEMPRIEQCRDSSFRKEQARTRLARAVRRLDKFDPHQDD